MYNNVYTSNTSLTKASTFKLKRRYCKVEIVVNFKFVHYHIPCAHVNI